mmetsp:Transcript_66944/g.157007  ORF Transcript_66944/g.157007 Transcript_66944/m.157007 type:complete len:223 (+) Transcript_66944:352-1020(+)
MHAPMAVPAPSVQAMTSQKPKASWATCHQSPGIDGQLLVWKFVLAWNMDSAPSAASNSSSKGACSTLPHVSSAKCQSRIANAWCTWTRNQYLRLRLYWPSFRVIVATFSFSWHVSSSQESLTAPQRVERVSKATIYTGPVSLSGTEPSHFTWIQISATLDVSAESACPKQNPPRCHDESACSVMLASSCACVEPKSSARTRARTARKRQSSMADTELENVGL